MFDLLPIDCHDMDKRLSENNYHLTKRKKGIVKYASVNVVLTKA
jgi:hypothetical protein